eukprot:1140250-Pelagomonas_calceolata.AAC.6
MAAASPVVQAQVSRILYFSWHEQQMKIVRILRAKEQCHLDLLLQRIKGSAREQPVRIEVSKSKATLPPPPRLPYHMEMWAGNAMAVLQVGGGRLQGPLLMGGTYV